MSAYGFNVKVNGNMEQVIKKVTEALQAEGFGILTEIDVQATLKKKLNIDRKPYRILGACNPGYAHQALDAEPDIGLLLPCNVVVREEADGSIDVGFMDPEAVLGLVKSDAVRKIGKEVRTKLERVRDALK